MPIFARTWFLIVALVASGFVFVGVAEAGGDGGSAADGGAASGDDDGFAEVDVTPVAVKPAGSKVGASLTMGKLLGRLHPLVVHLPVGWLLLLVLVEIVAALRRDAGGLAVAARWLLLGCVAVALAAVVTGLLRADELPPDAATLDHRNLMIALTALLVLALPLRWWRREDPLSSLRRGALGLLLLAALVLLLWGGHLGGELVRGSTYLPF